MILQNNQDPLSQTFAVGDAFLVLQEGDITRFEVDAVVTAANPRLAGGGGVDGAIHDAAGPELYAACRKIGGCPTGSAVITPGFQLDVKHVIHAVGPVWDGGDSGEPVMLQGAYASSLRLAKENGVKSVAFPAISAGIYGYPMEEAARIGLQTAYDFLRTERGSVERVVFALFGKEAYLTFLAVATEVLT